MFRHAALSLALAGIALVSSVPAAAADPDVASLRRGFANPPDDARIMMRWWWFGPAVKKPQLEKEMRAMKAGGIGGFEVQPVYPLAIDDPQKGFRNLPFLSPEFLDALRFTGQKAKELGLRFDLTLGSGWPFGGPTVSLEQAAGRLRIEKVRASGKTVLPSLRQGESRIAVFGPDNKELTPDSSGSVSASGEVLVFIAGHTGQAVKRAAAGAEGYVLDHYSDKALADYLKRVGEPLAAAVRENPPHAIFCDSLEVYGADWTPNFLEEFRQRRGYDLRPYLPALTRDIGPSSAGIRHDWGLTLTEIFQDHFLRQLHRFSVEHQVLLRMQDYGIPPAILSSNALIDLPEGEGSQWKVVRASRWASSASHIYGKPATSSETWTWLHSPVFRATPLDMKAEADIHFIQGITQLIGHGWPYTPDGVEYPGWRFYASAVFDDKNPWWIVMPDVSRYLQRVSWLLRQGEAANDVALYLPNADVWSDFRAGKVHMIEQVREHVGSVIMPQILDSGYGLDFVDDPAIANAAVLRPNKYRIVVLPGVSVLPVQTMRALEAFAKSGGLVVAVRSLPSRAPGLKASNAEHAEVRATAARMFPNGSVPESELGTVLKAARQPELRLAEPVAEHGFAHRRVADGDVFFVVNTANIPKSVDAQFRVPGNSAVESWNAFSGETESVAAGVRRAPAGVSMKLNLEPYGSRLLVFHRGTAVRESKPASFLSSETVNGPWTVSFGDGGPRVTMQQLRSWTDDERTRFFSGVATYQTTVDVHQDLTKSGSVVLDFGEGTALPIPADGGKRAGPGMQTWFDAPVREAAVVYVNGQRAGSVWCPPYRVDVTKLIHQGANSLRIEVANLAVNYMAGHPLPDYKELRAKYGNRFDPQDMDKLRAEPSGLLHPVRLLFGLL